jgi:glycosyltransferase involved in cell wall biosynthesis
MPPPPPAVSVLLAVRDGEDYLESALRSVMDQTLRDIEIVVVDDASTDGTPALLQRLAAQDGRLRVLRLEANRGLAGALNHGLDHARGPLIARMDHDDLSLPRRLEAQKAYLDRHPDVTLVGTSLEWIDAEGRTLRRWVRGRDPHAVAWQLRFGVHVSHPTWMFRRAGPDGEPLRYDPAVRVAQDYDFASRLVRAGGRIACLPDVLLRYRLHPGSVSSNKAAAQRTAAGRTCEEHHRATLPPLLFERLAPLRELYFGDGTPPADGYRAAFAAARAMLGHDLAQRPDRAAWLRRRTAQLMVTIMQRSGASKAMAGRALLRHGADFLLPLGLRVLEARRWLPRGLHSDPESVAAETA